MRGNGFCLLNSIITALYRDHDVVFYEQLLIDIIRAHVKNKGDNYLHLHPGTKMKLVSDVENFFSTANYDQEIADILLLIAIDAIHLNITLYWHSSRDVTIHNLPHKEGALLIFLQFLEHPEDPIGNHYNAIILKSNKHHGPMPLMPPPPPEVSKWRNRRPRGPVGQRITATYTPTSMQQKRSFSPDGFVPGNQCSPVQDYTSKCHAAIKMMHSYSSGESVGSTSVDSVATASELNENTSEHITSPIAEMFTTSTPIMGGQLHLLADLSAHVSPIPFGDVPHTEISSAMQHDSSLTDSAPETADHDTHLEGSAAEAAHGSILPTGKSSSDVEQCRGTDNSTMGIFHGDTPEMIDLTQEEVDTSSTSFSQISTDMERQNAECYITSLSADYYNNPTNEASHTNPNRHTETTMAMLNPHTFKPPTVTDGYMKPVMVVPVSVPGGGFIHKQFNVDVVPPDSDGVGGMRKGQEFPEWCFWNQVAKQVPHVPDDIDGMCLFAIKCTEDNWLQVTRDRRYFNMNSTKRLDFKGLRRVGWCEGSWVCLNEDCNFIRSSPVGEPNRSSFHIYGKRGNRQCVTCGHYAARDKCGARKMSQYNRETGVATVYHLGKHKCCLKAKSASKRKEMSEVIDQTQGRIPPREMQRQMVQKYVVQLKWDDAEQAAETWSDTPMVKNLLRDKDMANLPVDGSTFASVGIFKTGTDKKDKYFIYEINDGTLNNGYDYIFKSSLQSVQIGLAMDKDAGGNNPLTECVAYFDGVHDRVMGMKSLALWVCHPGMNRMLRLCNMECKQESTEEIAIFFNLWNEILAEVKGDVGYKFNPIAFMCDSLGANQQAVARVYGEDVAKYRLKTCRWHFLNNLHQRLAAVKDDNFTARMSELCHKLADTVTVADYELVLKDIQLIAFMYPNLNNFLHWWDTRKSQIFTAFRGLGYAGCNLSEQSNSGWQRKAPMTVLKAAVDDVTTMTQQKIDLNLFFSNKGNTSGHAPNQQKAIAKIRKDDMRLAKAMAEVVQEDNMMEKQVEELRHPSAYLAHGKSPMKPGKGKPAHAGKTFGRQKKMKPQSAFPMTFAALQEQLALAQAVLGEPVRREVDGLSTRPQKLPENPPMVMRIGDLSISRCQGCPELIQKGEPPYDLVIRNVGDRKFRSQHTGLMTQTRGNCYFHMDFTCLRGKHSAAEKRNITCTDEEFLGFEQCHFEELKTQEILYYVIANKL